MHCPAASSSKPEPSGTAGRCDVVVVGGGVIGLSIAWRCTTAGMSVTLCDPRPAGGASWMAAGMLAPVTEVHYGEEALLALNLAAARRWESFVEELEAVSGPVGYRRQGTLQVAATEDDRRWIEELFEFQMRLGLDVEWMSGRAARDLEGALAPGVRAGLWAGSDNQVDNRRLLAALVSAVGEGALCVGEAAEAIDTSGGRACGVHLASGGSVEAGAVVLAAGVHSPSVGGLPPAAVPAVRPVKGQILRLLPSSRAPSLGRSVRALVEGASVYLVPREDGSVVVGATVEEQGFDTAATAGAVFELLRDARRVVPGVAEMVLGEAGAGLRPGSPDNGPIVGPVEAVPGLVLATGHYRNGILLAPLTADAVLATLTGGEPPAETLPFGPDRFSTARL